MQGIVDSDVPTIVASGNSITCCAVIADGCSILCGTACGTLFAFSSSPQNPALGVLSYCKAAHAFGVRCLAENPDLSLVASGGDDAVCVVQPTLSLFGNSSNGIRKIRSHTLPITGMQFLPWAPHVVATCGLDGFVYISDGLSCSTLSSIHFGCALSTFALSLDGTSIIAARAGRQDDQVPAIAETDLFQPIRIRQSSSLLDASARKGQPVWKEVEMALAGRFKCQEITALRTQAPQGHVIGTLSPSGQQIVWHHGNVCGQPAALSDTPLKRRTARFSAITKPKSGIERDNKADETRLNWSLGWSSWWHCDVAPVTPPNDALWLCEPPIAIPASRKKRHREEALEAKAEGSPADALKREVALAEAEGKALQAACDALVGRLRLYANAKKGLSSGGGVSK